MKMTVKITMQTTREQLVAIIVEKLGAAGISAVLVGGAVVSIYTENKYESRDLDFVSSGEHSSIEALMIELGFKPQGREFVHPQTKFTVEFPPGPIAIGNEVPIVPEGELKVGKVKIQLLSPTQSVMDRLAWFYHANDRQCLDQALMIVRAQKKIDLKRVEKWSEKEGELEKFKLFLKRLNS